MPEDAGQGKAFECAGADRSDLPALTKRLRKAVDQPSAVG